MSKTRRHIPRGSQERETLTAQVVAAYKAGRSIRSIAAEFGKSYGMIHTLLAEAGVQFRPRGGPNRRKS